MTQALGDRVQYLMTGPDLSDDRECFKVPLIGIQALQRLPLRVARRQTRQRRGLLMVVSILSTQPCLSYILIEFSSTQCLIRVPSTRVFRSVWISPSNRQLIRLCKKRRTSAALKFSMACRINAG